MADKSMKGYKAFDNKLKCKGFQYEVGKEFVFNKEIIICERGFHFCTKLIDCFEYYSFSRETRVCEVESFGDTKNNDSDSKVVTDKIRIIRELSWMEVLEIINIGKENTGKGNSGNYNSGDYNSGHHNSGYYNSGYYNSGHHNSGHHNSGYYNSGHHNSGDYNSGHHNSGDYNSGYYNSGHHNSGDYNSGYYNSGNYNSGDYNSGFFNTDTPKTVRVFNKNVSRKVWEDARKPSFIHNVELTEWKEGKLVTYDYKEAWKKAFEEVDKEDVDSLIKLPNFDYTLFEEITGITEEIIKKKLELSK